METSSFFWIQSRPRIFWSKIRFYLFLYIVQLITYSSNLPSNQKWHKSAQNELPQKYTNQQIFSPNIKNYTHILSFYSQYSPIKISSETYLIKKKITKKKKGKDRRKVENKLYYICYYLDNLLNENKKLCAMLWKLKIGNSSTVFKSFRW